MFRTMNKRDIAINSANAVIIMLGSIIFMSGIFHNNLWLNESYTVGLVRGDFFDMFRVLLYDVHLPSYYVLLKLFSLVFGTSLVMLRVFSLICWVALGSLGIFHIRRDFGSLTGLIYSAICFFSIVGFTYAGEIQAYSLSALLVALCAIYAHRYYKTDYKGGKNRNLFLLFSILAAYSHYYATVAVLAVNVLIYIHQYKYSMLKVFIKNAALQFILIFPVFYYAYRAYLNLTANNWITVEYPDFILRSFSLLVESEFARYRINNNLYTLIVSFSFIFGLILIYNFRSLTKENPTETRAGTLAFYVFMTVNLVFLLISFVSPAFYFRYQLVLFGLIAFVISVYLVKHNLKSLTAIFLFFLIFSFLLQIGINFDLRYSDDNKKIDDFITENFEPKDIIISERIGLLGDLAVKYPEYQYYFYYTFPQNDPQAYDAYGDSLNVVFDLDFVSEHNGRIWFLDKSDVLTGFVAENFDRDELAEYEPFATPYRDYYYSFTLAGK